MNWLLDVNALIALAHQGELVSLQLHPWLDKPEEAGPDPAPTRQIDKHAAAASLFSGQQISQQVMELLLAKRLSEARGHQ